MHQMVFAIENRVHCFKGKTERWIPKNLVRQRRFRNVLRRLPHSEKEPIEWTPQFSTRADRLKETDAWRQFYDALQILKGNSLRRGPF